MISEVVDGKVLDVTYKHLGDVYQVMLGATYIGTVGKLKRGQWLAAPKYKIPTGVVSGFMSREYAAIYLLQWHKALRDTGRT